MQEPPQTLSAARENARRHAPFLLLPPNNGERMLKPQAAMKRTLAHFILLGGICLVPKGWAATVTDNFDTGDDTAPPVAWSRYDPIFDATAGGVALGDWSFPEGKGYRLMTQPSPERLQVS